MDLCSIFILLYHTLKVNDLSNDVNLDKILKLDLGYWKLSCIWTLPNYLDCLWKDVFAMIKEFGHVQKIYDIYYGYQ
jgi:hypothetical protein